MRTATLTLTLDSRRAIWGIRLAGFLAPLIGPERAVRLAQFAVDHGLRYRTDKGRWQPLTGIRLHMNAIEQHPVEDPLDDPNHQVPDEGLPAQVTGNDEDDEGEDDGTA